jgi:23S rRNA (adenine2503-C2)-methyltransferase
MGRIRNLTAAEIYDQAFLSARLCEEVFDFPLTNIVYMGMGEPLLNYAPVMESIRMITSADGMAWSARRITVSTAGIAKMIRRLGDEQVKFNLALSLHAADDEKRDRIMPINRRVPLAELQAALVAYPRRPGFVFAVNYCLLPGINDGPEDARAVAAWCAPLGRVLVNVIPYNPGTRPLTRPPTEDEIAAFVAALAAEGVAVRRRVTKGRSVMAACGQLGNVELRKQRRALALAPGGEP